MQLQNTCFAFDTVMNIARIESEPRPGLYEATICALLLQYLMQEVDLPCIHFFALLLHTLTAFLALSIPRLTDGTPRCSY